MTSNPSFLIMSLASFSLILGACCYVFGFPLVFSNEKHLAWRREVVKDENALRLMALVLLSVAVTTLRYQYRIAWDGEGILVFFAWVTFFKGLFMAGWPATFGNVAEVIESHVMSNQAMEMFAGFIMVLLGALFTYLGLILA